MRKQINFYIIMACVVFGSVAICSQRQKALIDRCDEANFQAWKDRAKARNLLGKIYLWNNQKPQRLDCLRRLWGEGVKGKVPAVQIDKYVDQLGPILGYSIYASSPIYSRDAVGFKKFSKSVMDEMNLRVELSQRDLDDAERDYRQMQIFEERSYRK